jgi:hypothetical protein
MGSGSGMPIHTNQVSESNKRGKDQKISVKPTLIFNTVASKSTITPDNATKPATTAENEPYYLSLLSPSSTGSELPLIMPSIGALELLVGSAILAWVILRR